MNNEKIRSIRDKLYIRLIQETIKAVGTFLGYPMTEDLKKKIIHATFPLINRTRDLMTSQAYKDYVEVVKTNPVAKIPLNRFTEDLWKQSIDKHTADDPYLTVTVSEKIGTSADYWARDAEWGERVQLAKADSRVGRIARVDFNPPTCPFCTLLNSRGPVYLSEDAFIRTLHLGDTCSAIFVLEGETHYPGMEHTSEALRRYTEVVQKDPHLGSNGIMQKLREQHPNRSPGIVKTTVQQASQNAQHQQINRIRAQIQSLEAHKIRTSQGHSVQQGTIATLNSILTALETK